MEQKIVQLLAVLTYTPSYLSIEFMAVASDLI